jgi:hypothetical protein
MDVKPLMAEMIAERERLNRAIAALEAFDQHEPLAESPRRGRPPGSHNKRKVFTPDLPVNGNQHKPAAVFPRD